MTKRLSDSDVKPGMIVTLRDCPNEKYEVLSVSGNLKELLRREDLERRAPVLQD